MYLVINISSSYRDKQNSILYHILSNKSTINYDPQRWTLFWSKKYTFDLKEHLVSTGPFLIKAALAPTSIQSCHKLFCGRLIQGISTLKPVMEQTDVQIGKTKLCHPSFAHVLRSSKNSSRRLPK